MSITGTPLREFFRENTRELSSSSTTSEIAPILEALAEYGQPDDDVAQSLLDRCRSIAPESTVPEILHFVHQKGSLVRQDRSGRISSPIGFLLTAVPKCFLGETFTRYRQEEQRRQENERITRERQETEIEQWRQEQEQILNDPDASEEDKRFARRVLGLGD